jgi:hypothetical protein
VKGDPGSPGPAGNDGVDGLSFVMQGQISLDDYDKLFKEVQAGRCPPAGFAWFLSYSDAETIMLVSDGTKILKSPTLNGPKGEDAAVDLNTLATKADIELVTSKLPKVPSKWENGRPLNNANLSGVRFRLEYPGQDEFENQVTLLRLRGQVSNVPTGSAWTQVAFFGRPANSSFTIHDETIMVAATSDARVFAQVRVGLNSTGTDPALYVRFQQPWPQTSHIHTSSGATTPDWPDHPMTGGSGVIYLDNLVFDVSN